MSAAGDRRRDEIKWCSISCALWNSVEERRADAARKTAEIDDKTSAATARGGAALFARRQRVPSSEQSTIHDAVYEERKATALQRIHSEFRALSRRSQANADIYRSMALDGSLSVACMSVWAHVPDSALYEAYCGFMLTAVASVPDRRSPTAAKQAVCARLVSDSHVRVILSEELDSAWFGEPPLPAKAAMSLDYECACLDDTDDLSYPPRSCSPVPGVCHKANASVCADDDSDEEAEEYWERARNLLASDVCDILAALASEARALHSGSVCTKITHVSVAMRRHSSDGFECGLVAVAERGALATSNVCEGCWSGIASAAAPDEWPSLARSVHAYVIRDDASEFACATLDMCCGAVRVSSAREALLALPTAIGRTRARASEACWDRLWVSVVGRAVFPGASEGVRAQFADKHSVVEQFASTTSRDAVNLGAQDNVLMRLTSVVAASSGSSGRRVYLQSKCSPYFYMSPEIVKECKHSLEETQAELSFACGSGSSGGSNAKSSSEMTFDRGSNPKCILSAYQKSRSSDTTAESACIDHSPDFSSRRSALNNDDAAASYIGMRSLRGLGAHHSKLREIYSRSAWVRRWLVTCERQEFCTCRIGTSVDEMPAVAATLARSSPRRSTEQVRAQLLWNGVIDASCLRLFDETNRRARDIEHAARSSMESRQVMERFRQHSSQVSENIDLYVDRISEEARSDERGYRVLVDGTQYGTVNVRERVVYRFVCAESALCLNFGIWSAEEANATLLCDEAKHGVRIALASGGAAKHIDVTIVDARKFIASAMCDEDVAEECIGSAKVSFGAVTGRRRNLFGFIRLVEAAYSGALVTESHLSAAPSRPPYRSSPFMASAAVVAYSHQSQLASDSPEASDEDYSDDDDDVLVEKQSIMYQVGIVFIYTPLKAGISLPPRVYKKRLPLSGPRVRDKEWFFSPMKADPTLDDCSEKIADLGGDRPTATVLTLSSDTYYRFAVVMDPRSDAPIDEVQCPALRIYDDDRSEVCVAKLPDISTESRVQWSEMFAVSGSQQDGGLRLEGGTLQLPVLICADDSNRPTPEMVFRIAHT